MLWSTIIFIILVGILLMLLDFLVIPGGFVAIFGVLCIVGGIVAAFVSYGTTAGMLTLLGTAIVIMVSFVLMMRSKTWRKLQLKTEIDGRMNEVDLRKVQVGMVGKAVSRLAPMGTGMFGDELVEVASVQDFIEANTEIEIVKIDANKIIVKPKI